MFVINSSSSKHLADHAGDVVAIAIEVGQVVQAGGCHVLLKLRHAVRHDPHAAFERASLGSTKPVCDADDPGGVGDQVMLAGGRRRRQPRAELARERLRCFSTGHDLDEAFRKRLLLPGGQRGLVLNGVCDSAQEIGIAHHVTESAWKLRNRERKGAGHALQDCSLVGEVALRRHVRGGRRHPDACPIFSSPNGSYMDFTVGLSSRAGRFRQGLRPGPGWLTSVR